MISAEVLGVVLIGQACMHALILSLGGLMLCPVGRASLVCSPLEWQVGELFLDHRD